MTRFSLQEILNDLSVAFEEYQIFITKDDLYNLADKVKIDQVESLIETGMCIKKIVTHYTRDLKKSVGELL